MAENAGDHASAFGGVADPYDRSRPSYPDALVDDVLELCKGNATPAFEVGAGTGKATTLFASRGLDMVAIEPSPDMAAIARKNCAAYPRVSIFVSTFEDWRVEPESFGLLISAQAWHWVTPDIRYRKAHQLLRRAGGLALFWNRPVWEESPLGDALAAVYETRAPELHALGPWFPGFRQPTSDSCTDGEFGPGCWLPAGRPSEIETSGYFESVTERSYQWSLEHTASGYVDLLRTLPEHEGLPDDRREHLFRCVADVIKASGDVLRMGYETRLYFGRRAG